jgi:hypothetical protein
MLEISAFQRLRQQDAQFEANLGYTAGHCLKSSQPLQPPPKKKLVAIPNAGEDAEKQDFSSFANGNERWYHILETVQTFL